MALGCSKKAEQNNQPVPAKQEPVAEAPPPTQAEEKPAEAPKRAEEAPEPAPGMPKVDCGAIVTAEDFQQACNAKVELAATMYEGQGSLMVCNRKVRAPGKPAPIARFGISTFANAAVADKWVEMSKYDEAEPVEGIGDKAWITKRESKGLKVTDHEVVVRKGNLLLLVGYTEGGVHKKPPCTIEQFVEVAKLAAPRLP